MADVSLFPPTVVVGARLLLYVGVLLALGRALTALIGSPAPAGPTATIRALLVGGAAALFVAPGLLLQQQLLALEMPFADAAMLVRETAWGRGWLALTVAATLSALVLLLQTRHWPSRSATPRVLAMALAASGMALSITMGALGHPAADPRWPVLARVVDAAHVLGMGGWIGGLLITWCAVQDGPHAWAMASWRAFSRAATMLAPLTVLSGMAGSALRLAEATWPAALGTAYVQWLVVKSVLVLIVLAYGARQRQRVQRAQRPPSRAIAQEAIVALVVLAVTAVLTGTEPPSAP